MDPILKLHLLRNSTPKISFINPGSHGHPALCFTPTLAMIPNYLATRPWIFVAVAFSGFVIWWMFFISMAIKNAPPEIPLVSRTVHAGH